MSFSPGRVEILSPGALFDGLTKEEMLEGKSRLRNPLVANVFHKMAIIETWGTGIRRMFALCRKSGATAPSVHPGPSAVSVCFPRPVIVGGNYPDRRANYPDNYPDRLPDYPRKPSNRQRNHPRKPRFHPRKGPVANRKGSCGVAGQSGAVARLTRAATWNVARRREIPRFPFRFPSLPLCALCVLCGWNPSRIPPHFPSRRALPLVLFLFFPSSTFHSHLPGGRSCPPGTLKELARVV